MAFTIGLLLAREDCEFSKVFSKVRLDDTRWPTQNTSNHCCDIVWWHTSNEALCFQPGRIITEKHYLNCFINEHSTSRRGLLYCLVITWKHMRYQASHDVSLSNACCPSLWHYPLEIWPQLSAFARRASSTVFTGIKHAKHFRPGRMNTSCQSCKSCNFFGWKCLLTQGKVTTHPEFNFEDHSPIFLDSPQNSNTKYDNTNCAGEGTHAGAVAEIWEESRWCPGVLKTVRDEWKLSEPGERHPEAVSQDVVSGCASDVP